MSGILESIGVHGLLANRAEFLEETDEEAEEWGSFIAMWASTPQWDLGEKVRTKDLAVLVQAEGLCETLGIDEKKDVARQLGRRLSSKNNSIIGGYRIEKYGPDGYGYMTWRLVQV